MNINKTRQKEKEREQGKFQTNNKKTLNQFKTLYQMTKKRRTKNQQRNINQWQERDKINQMERHSKSKCITDSLQNFQIANQQQQLVNDLQPHGTQVNGDYKKKWSHNRSQSCPFMNPSINQLSTPIKVEVRQEKNPINYNKFIIENESKRTLKKSSTMHRKNKRPDQKYSIGQYSQLSQQSNTVIVHSLPIQHLSSMLYSLNHEKQRNFKKVTSPRAPQYIFSIHTDLYFQTRLQQQIKMYDLNEELKKLNRQTENVKIKQEVLQKLANKFDKNSEINQSQQSLLIH